MSPLVASPNRGYADWQRVENYDSGILWSLPPVAQPGPVTSPVLDVSRYGYIGGLLANTLGSIALVIFRWYADPAATVLVGERLFTQNNQMPTPAQLRYPNLGPFCQIQITAPLGGNIAPSATLFGTNRVHPCEFIPLYPYLMELSGNVATGETDLFLLSYYAGPAMLTCALPSSGVGIAFKYSDASGVAQQYDQLNVVTGAAIQRQVVVVPAGITWIVVLNISGAAQNVSLYMLPSTTGAT